MAGLCAVPWRQRSIGHVNTSIEEQSVQNTSTLDAPWLVVRQEMCGDGWHPGAPSPAQVGDVEPAPVPILGAGFSEERLLASYFPEQRWTDEEALFCNEL